MLQKDRDYERGFRLLMNKYQERLYWHIRRMAGDHEDANDVLQNCFIKIYRNIQSFEGKSKLYTWLYRIATNETITYLKRRNKKKSVSMDDEELNLSNRLEADTFFDGDQALKILHRVIALLPEKQQLVFNMRYFDEMPYQDMSDVLDTSVGALKASYHHAVKKVEKHLKEVASG
jgi:RNA polymerase sigma factor (sigma-70 family)